MISLSDISGRQSLAALRRRSWGIGATNRKLPRTAQRRHRLTLRASRTVRYRGAADVQSLAPAAQDWYSARAHCYSGAACGVASGEGGVQVGERVRHGGCLVRRKEDDSDGQG